MSRTGRYSSQAFAAARFVTQRMLLKPLVWSLCKVSVIGAERLQGLTGPFVVVANHSSHLDASTIVCAIPLDSGRYLATGAAADYFFKRLHRKVFTSLLYNAFPIERAGVRNRRSVAAQLLSEGVPILLFPEGTRSASGGMAPFKPGAAALCINQGVPAVPVAMVGAHEAMPKGRSWPRAGRPPVSIVFGDPVRPEPGETPVAFSQRLAETVRRLFDGTARELGLPTMAERPVPLRGRGTRSAIRATGTVASDPAPGPVPADTVPTGTDPTTGQDHPDRAHRGSRARRHRSDDIG